MKEASEFITQKIDKKVFAGAAVLAGRRDKILFEDYQGHISKKSSVLVNEQSFFDLQSITKSLVTSPLIYVLITKRILTLEEKILGIPLHQYLSHTAGYDDKDLDFKIKNPHEAWKRIFTKGPSHKPNSKVFYADMGYRILGKYIEMKMGQNLEVLAQKFLYQDLGITDLTFSPPNPFSTTGVPRSHGRIDDEKVFQMGSILGDDGLFGTAKGISSFLKAMLEEKGPLKGYQTFLAEITLGKDFPINFYEALRLGNKTLGWEKNSFPTSYAGINATETTHEKSGGAGTFIWLDYQSKSFFIYLTNYGKPEPFKEKKWNKLVQEIGPDELSEIIFS